MGNIQTIIMPLAILSTSHSPPHAGEGDAVPHSFEWARKREIAQQSQIKTCALDGSSFADKGCFFYLFLIKYFYF
jgi:hypothetical protein